jgi:cytochrome P450
MGTNGYRLPPGPRGWPLVGVAFEVRKDPLTTMKRYARQYGDIVCLPVGRESRILLTHPDAIEQVLVIQQSKFHKSELTRLITGRLLGQGLLISEGDFWRRQRRLVQPAFHRSRINAYAATMTEIAEAHVHEWRAGDKRDMAQEMMALTLNVALRTLFGATMPHAADQVGQAIIFLMRYQLYRMRSPIRIPKTWPTPKNRRAEREFELLDSLAYRIISDRETQKNGAHGNDLLSLMMEAMDEDGTQMTREQLRDETMTLFLAGHETTAQTLAWSWFLLSQNPAAETRLFEELRGVLAGRSPEPGDLARLPYLHAVISEVLRLYPPAYVTARTSIERCQIADYDFPPDTTFLLSQWVTHRDARFYEDPEAFRPERWLGGLAQRLTPGAYFPFGDGPRRCIGQGFAMLEASVVLGTLAQRFRFQLIPGQSIVPEPLITLRPRHGVRMTLESRS